ERGELDDKLDAQRDERRKVDAQKKDLQAKLRGASDPKMKADLEKRVAQLAGRGREIDRVIAHNQRARDERFRSIEQSMKREEDPLAEAARRFEQESKRLEEESRRLDEEEERLVKALAVEEERIE